MNIKSTYRMCYDLEPGHALYLGSFLMSCGMSFAEVASNLHLGQKGNIERISFKDIVGPADFLIAGPPCPHWSRGLGCKKTIKVFKSAAFVEVKCAPWHCLSVQQFQYMRSSPLCSAYELIPKCVMCCVRVLAIGTVLLIL